MQQSLAAFAAQIAEEFYNHIGAAYEGGHFVEQTDESRAYFVPRVKRCFENPENHRHILERDIEHII
ncbi:MAG: hypothetical protein LBT58_01555 [Endomicrobium sp.]|jgi:hypothetical protein|nr:hypothetical protein [Endomicrobium sp.]